MTFEIPKRPCADHQDSVSSLAFSVDGQLLASGGLDGVLKIWDTTSGDLKCTLEGPTGNIEVIFILMLLNFLLVSVVKTGNCSGSDGIQKDIWS